MKTVKIIQQKLLRLKQSAIQGYQEHRYKRWFIPAVIAMGILVLAGVTSAAYVLISNPISDQPLSLTDNTVNPPPDKVNDKSEPVSSPSATQNGGSSTEANDAVPPIQSGQVVATHVSSGGVNLKTTSGSSSTTTASISPQGGGMLLVWVGTAVGGEDSVIVPSISGLNLNWSVVKFSQKKEGAPRAMTLFKAALPANPGSGPLTIHFNTSLTSSHWFWEIDRVSGTKIKNIYERVDGGFVTSYAMTLSPATKAGNAAIAGMLVGNNDVGLTPGSGLTLLGTGGTSFATVGSAWTSQSRGVMDFSWNKPAHCLMVAIEVEP